MSNWFRTHQGRVACGTLRNHRVLSFLHLSSSGNMTQFVNRDKLGGICRFAGLWLDSILVRHAGTFERNSCPSKTVHEVLHWH